MSLFLLGQIKIQSDLAKLSIEARDVCRNENMTKMIESANLQISELTANFSNLTGELNAGWESFLAFKNDFTRKLKLLEVSTDERVSSAYSRTLNESLDQAVPIGFTYTQLPFQPEPSEIWSWATWENVTGNYSNHFFRAEGNASEPFGTSQSDAMQNHITPSQRSSGGEFSRRAHRCYNCDVDSDINFLRMASETRPLNYAVRIWKRIA